MSLRKDIDAGLEAVVRTDRLDPPVLDKHGRATFEFEHPSLSDEMVVIGILLGPGERSASLSCVLGRHRFEDAPNGTIAMLETNHRFANAGGAVFAIDSVNEQTVLIQHWSLSHIGESDFVKLFKMFCAQAAIWRERFSKGEFPDARFEELKGCVDQ